MGSKLYVGNLAYTTSEQTLQLAFAQDGREVERVSIVTDRDTGRSRGFAFVQMASETDAKAAMDALDGTELDGRSLRVTEARERDDRRRGERPPPRRDTARAHSANDKRPRVRDDGDRPSDPSARPRRGDSPEPWESAPPWDGPIPRGDEGRGRGRNSRRDRDRSDRDGDGDFEHRQRGRGRGRKGNWKRDWDL